MRRRTGKPARNLARNAVLMRAVAADLASSPDVDDAVADSLRRLEPWLERSATSDLARQLVLELKD